jgi:hypothetical protein
VLAFPKTVVRKSPSSYERLIIIHNVFFNGLTGAVQIHLLTFQEMPRMKHPGLISDNPPIVNLGLEISMAVAGEGMTLTLQPQGTPLSYERNGDYIAVQLPEIAGYSILEIH